MTVLVTMVADLNLNEVSMKYKIVRFNCNVNHFIIEFADDDGAPESKEKTLWNYGRCKIRHYKYMLRTLST